VPRTTACYYYYYYYHHHHHHHSRIRCLATSDFLLTDSISVYNTYSSAHTWRPTSSVSLKRSAQVQCNYNTTATQEFFLVLQLYCTCADRFKRCSSGSSSVRYTQIFPLYSRTNFANRAFHHVSTHGSTVQGVMLITVHTFRRNLFCSCCCLTCHANLINMIEAIFEYVFILRYVRAAERLTSNSV